MEAIPPGEHALVTALFPPPPPKKKRSALLPFGGHIQAQWELAGNRIPGFLIKCIEAVEKRGAASERVGKERVDSGSGH